MALGLDGTQPPPPQESHNNSGIKISETSFLAISFPRGRGKRFQADQFREAAGRGLLLPFPAITTDPTLLLPALQFPSNRLDFIRG